MPSMRSMSLGVVPGRSAWRLSLEALVTAADGAVLDALSLAAKAALADAALPQARPRGPSHDAFCAPSPRCTAHPARFARAQLELSGGDAADGAEFEVADAVRRLDISSVPLVVTVSRVRAPARWRGHIQRTCTAV